MIQEWLSVAVAITGLCFIWMKLTAHEKSAKSRPVIIEHSIQDSNVTNRAFPSQTKYSGKTVKIFNQHLSQLYTFFLPHEMVLHGSF